MPSPDPVGHLDIRLAREGEGQLIAEVKRACWQEAYLELLPAEVLAGLELNPTPEQWEGAIAAGRAPFVADLDGDLVGLSHVGPSTDADAGDDVGELYVIYLRALFWGKGVGHQLHEAALDRLRQEGFTSARLWVLEGNTRARQFYEAHGWTPEVGPDPRRLEFLDSSINERCLSRRLT